MMVLLFLVALAFADDNNGLGYPCKASVFKQYTKCKGKKWVNGENPDTTTRKQCADNCKLKGDKYGYFGWNSDESYCRCYTCNKGAKVTSQRDYPNTQGRNLLFKIYSNADGSEKGVCRDVAESGSACDMHQAQEGTRCFSSADCAGDMTCCENYKVCGDQASGNQIAINGKAYNPTSGKWDLTINWDTWPCSEVGSEVQVQVAVSADQCGMPTWAYGMFALLIVNPVVLLWSQRQKGDHYRNLLDEQ